MDYSLTFIFLFFVLAFVAGWVDTNAGGGGLLTIPTLLLAGVPPLMALGTNKLQGTVGTATATITLIKQGRLNISDAWPLMLAAGLGAVLGTFIVQWINTDWIEWIVPAVLLFIATYFWFQSPVQQHDAKPKISETRYRMTAVPVVGLYDGILGPGTGSFMAMIGVGLRGMSLIEATIQAKAMNFATNIASAVVFIMAGKVIWTIGLPMMLGQVLGARLGTYFVLSKGEKLIRPVVITVCLVLCAAQIYTLI